MRYRTEHERYVALTTILEMCLKGPDEFVPPVEPIDHEPTDGELVALQTYDYWSGSIFSKVSDENSFYARENRRIQGHINGKKRGRPRKDGSSSSDASNDGLDDIHSELPPSNPSQTNEKGPTSISSALGIQVPPHSEEPPPTAYMTDCQKQIKSPEDLQRWIKGQYFGSESLYARNLDFCKWAFQRLVDTNWRHTKDNSPIKNLAEIILPLVRGHKRYLKIVEKQKQEEKVAAAAEAETRSQQEIDDYRQMRRRSRFD